MRFPQLSIKDLAGNDFHWWKGKYVVRRGKKNVVLLGRAYEYTPNLERLCEVLASLREEDIPWFFNEYGPFGSWGYYLKTGAYKSYARSYAPEETNAQFAWAQEFGLLLDVPREKPAGGSTLLAYDPEDEARPFYPGDNSFRRVYREPLGLAQLALAEFHHAVEAVLAGETHHALRLRLEYDGEGALICRAGSLLEGIYANLLWGVTHGRVFRECAGRARYKCGVCRYHKMYFWGDNPRRIIGQDRCKVYQKARARDYRLRRAVKKWSSTAAQSS